MVVWIVAAHHRLVHRLVTRAMRIHLLQGIAGSGLLGNGCAAGDASWVGWILESLLDDSVAEGACDGKGCGERGFRYVITVMGALAC